jgi:hypothetical protein
VTAVAGPGVHLWVPGLLSPRPEGWSPPPSLPALTTLLARAKPLPFGVEASVADQGIALARLFGVATPLPIAALSRLGELGGDLDECLLLAAPVHLHPDRDRLRLFGGPSLGVAEGESRQLLAEFNTHFAPQGLRLEWAAPDRWYLHTPHPPEIETVPLAQMLGHSVQGHLPQGGEARLWHGILNEAQMLFHLSAVNRSREAAGALPLNSLWVWGNGRAPQDTASPFAALFADHLPSRGMAAISGVPLFDLDALERYDHSPRSTVLVVDATPAEAISAQDEGAWQTALRRLDGRLDGLRRRRPPLPLWLHADDGYCRRLLPWERYRFWRRRLPW